MLPRSNLVKRPVIAGSATAAMAALVLGTACSPAPMPISQSHRDPSSPLAPEGASAPVAAAAPAAAPPPSGSDHEHHGHSHAGHEAHGAGVAASADGGTQGEVYVCPMHPEVTSTTPGALCPKCNMKLVPKK